MIKPLARDKLRSLCPSYSCPQTMKHTDAVFLSLSHGHVYYLKRELSCERELVSLKQASVDVVKGGEGDTVDERTNASLNISTRLGVLHRLTENHIERLRTGHKCMHFKETSRMHPRHIGV